MTQRDYDNSILDSNEISPVDRQGRPIPVTIPIALAPGITVVYTTRLGGVSRGDFAGLNLGGKGGDHPAHVASNRLALAEQLGVHLSLVNQVHSGVAVDIDDRFTVNTPHGFDASGTKNEEVDTRRGHTDNSSSDGSLNDSSGDSSTSIDGAGSGSGDSGTWSDRSSADMQDDGRGDASAAQHGTSPGMNVHDRSTGLPADSERPVIAADAQVTSLSGVALGIFAADCLPVMLADAEAGVIGAAHCGRRGLMNGVIGETVGLMEAKGARRERIVATLGPCICGDCYEVGDRIADEFDAKFPGTFTLTRFGGPGIDIAAAAMQDLAAAGIPQDNVISSRPRVGAATQYLSQDEELARLCREDGEGETELTDRIDGVRHSLCTLENPLWYSHRRAALAGKQREGRLLALIVKQ